MDTLWRVLGWAVAHPDELAVTLSAVAGVIAAIQRWAVAKKLDRLAGYAAAAGRGAGRINLAMSRLPPGADVGAAMRALLLNEASAQMAEFSTTAPKIGATLEKTQAMIEGELGRLPTMLVEAVRS